MKTTRSARWALLIPILIVGAVVHGAPGPVPACLPPLASRPNVIIILSDDLGYADLGAQGCRDIPTPAIDSIARNGIRFTSGYVTAPVCSPSRAGFLTGRYQQRFGHETNPGTSLETSPFFGLPLTETTLGDRFKDLNYSTGWIGKSHQGGTPQFYPLRRGFDEFFGFIESHHDYFDTGERLDLQDDPIRNGTNAIVESSYLTTAFARECVQFIDRHANEPFLLYAPFNAVHFPQQATTNLIQRAAQLPIDEPRRRIMAAMLLGLDDAVGAILAKLRQLNLETNTLIFFTTDNGGNPPARLQQCPASRGKNRGLRGRHPRSVLRPVEGAPSRQPGIPCARQHARHPPHVRCGRGWRDLAVVAIGRRQPAPVPLWRIERRSPHVAVLEDRDRRPQSRRRGPGWHSGHPRRRLERC